MTQLKRSFPPVINSDIRLLVLGSLPGEQSLARAQYYAHPRNHFWRLIGDVIGEDLVPSGYERRLDALLQAGIGLWDVVASAARNGSLDGNIRHHSPNALADLATSLPRLNAIAFNGGTAARIARKQLARETRLVLVSLPSSSPAYTLAYERKREAWLKLRDFICRR